MKLWGIWGKKENEKEKKGNEVGSKARSSFGEKLMAPETIKKLVVVGLVNLAVWATPFANCGGDNNTKTPKPDVYTYSDIAGKEDVGNQEEPRDKIVYYETRSSSSTISVFCYIEDDRNSIGNIVNSPYFSEVDWANSRVSKEEYAEWVKNNWVSVDPTKIIKVRLIAFNNNVKPEDIKNEEIKKYKTEMETPLGKLSIKNEAYSYINEYTNPNNIFYFIPVYSRNENGELVEFEYNEMIYHQWGCESVDGDCMNRINNDKNNGPRYYYVFPCFFGCIGEKKDEETKYNGTLNTKSSCEKAMIFEFRIMPGDISGGNPGDLNHEDLCFFNCIRHMKRGCMGDPMRCD